MLRGVLHLGILDVARAEPGLMPRNEMALTASHTLGACAPCTCEYGVLGVGRLVVLPAV